MPRMRQPPPTAVLSHTAVFLYKNAVGRTRRHFIVRRSYYAAGVSGSVAGTHA